MVTSPDSHTVRQAVTHISSDDQQWQTYPLGTSEENEALAQNKNSALLHLEVPHYYEHKAYSYSLA